MARTAVAVAICICVGLLWGCNDDADRDGFTAAEWDVIHTLSPLHDILYDEAAAELGQQLFFEKRLSGEIIVGDDGQNNGLGQEGEVGKVACSSCHMPVIPDGDPETPDTHAWFVDKRSRPNATSLGTGWTTRNAPTIVNAIYHESFPWHGKFTSIADLMPGPLKGEPLMNSDEDRLVRVLSDHYGLTFTEETVLDEIGFLLEAYQRRIISRNAPFDRYVAGDLDAISASAKRGLGLFIGDALCIECHSGPAFSDEGFHRTGIEQYGEHVPPEDPGKEDGRFRTPTLRSVAETAPYMHAGQLETLTDVVDFYWDGCNSGNTEHPAITPLELTSEDQLDLVAFLETLTGEPIPDELIEDTSAP